MPNDFLGFFSGASKQFAGLAEWRASHGWDKNSATAAMQIDFDPDSLELTIGGAQPLPKVRAVDQVGIDMLGKETGATRAPGPLAHPGAKRTWRVDPRSTV